MFIFESSDRPTPTDVSSVWIAAETYDRFRFDTFDMPEGKLSDVKTVPSKDVFFEIHFANGERFCSNCAQGKFSFGMDLISEDTDYSCRISAQADGTNGISISRLRENARNNVPVLGTFAMCIDADGIRRVLANTKMILRFNDGALVVCNVDQAFRNNPVPSKGTPMIDTAIWC